MDPSTKLFFLSIYHATPHVPLSDQTVDSIFHRGRLQSLDTGSGGLPKTLLANLHMPDGIAISKSRNLIFWTQMGTPNQNDGSVCCAELDGKNPKIILRPGVAHTPKQIVLVEGSERLYFCDREGLRIHSCDLDGSNHEVLLQTGDWRNEHHCKDQTRWCVGITLSHRLGKIFWTQKGAPKSGQGRIFSMNIEKPGSVSADSRSDIEVVADGLPEPIDLEMDDEAGALYWTDRGEFPFGNTLNKKIVVGPTPAAMNNLGREILAEGFGEAIGLALDDVNDCVWVADLCGRVWQCDRHQPAAKRKVYDGEASVFTGLAVLHA